MKKMITGLVLGALCCAMFSTPAFPTKYDPSRPPPTPYANVGTSSSSGDDIGWTEPATRSGGISIEPIDHPWNRGIISGLKSQFSWLSLWLMAIKINVDLNEHRNAERHITSTSDDRVSNSK